MPQEMQEISFFRTESRNFYDFIANLEAADYMQPTAFKGWDLNTILTHLWIWNWAAEISATDPERLQDYLQNMLPYILKHDMPAYETIWSNGLAGPELREKWWQSVESLCTVFSGLDAKTRLKWAGPDMSARSSITARLMETWAHIQAFYDLKKTPRPESPALKAIAFLGVNTFGWSFKNRKLEIPAPTPAVILNAPDGEIWEWHSDNQTDRIEGPAEAFCQVVTQTRNIADTDLQVTGPIAKEWMRIAQCFAGPPETPPAAGSRG